MLHHTLASQTTGTMNKYLNKSDLCIIEINLHCQKIKV